jgi:hypothetical protein
MAEVEMYHPDLEETFMAQEKAVHVYERSGWRRKDAEEAETAPEPGSRSKLAPREPAEPEDEKE